MKTCSSGCLILEDNAETGLWLADIVRQAYPTADVRLLHSLAETRPVLAALRQARSAPPELALVDLSLPDGSGLDFITALSSVSPATAIIVTTTFVDDGSIFQSLMKGARGYILKSERPEMIKQLLVRIGQGEPSLSPSVAIRVLDYFTRQAPAAGTPDEALTPRETETLKLIAKGLTAAEVGDRLGLKTQTVSSYIKVIYQKLNISSRAEAAREALRRGLL